MLDSSEQIAAQSTLTESATKANTYRLLLRVENHPVNETARLRQLLKIALRRFRLKCLRIEKVAEESKL